MIRDVGNIELCKLLETEPRTQCKVCLSYWNICNLYFTCGHFLHKERGRTSKDLLSVPEYAIRKGRPHGHRFGKKPGDKEYHTANQIEAEVEEEVFPRNPWSIHTRSRIPSLNDWKQSRRRTLPKMGCSCGWRSYPPFDPQEYSLQEKLVASFETSRPNFEVLDARTASALNNIIHNSDFKRRISLEEQKAQKQDRYFRGRQMAYLIRF